MKCLHGQPCAQSTTEKGTFWFCNQNPSCNLICSEDENYLYEKAIGAWKSTKQPQPHCEKCGKFAKIRIVKNLLKANYGRPFFVCSEQTNPCSFWAWGDVQAVAKPKSRHGSQCAVGKVKKETVNKDRYSFAVLKKIRATTSNGCPKKVIPTLNSFHPQQAISSSTV